MTDYFWRLKMDAVSKGSYPDYDYKAAKDPRMPSTNEPYGVSDKELLQVPQDTVTLGTPEKKEFPKM